MHSREAVESAMEKLNRHTVMPAMEKEIHKINVQLDHDTHPLFTPDEMQALYRNEVISSTDHDSLIDDL